MNPLYRRCCGIDVHKKSITVCVLAPDNKPKGEVRKEKFRTFTRDLIRMRTFLVRCGVTEVVMESTGQYWRPVWNVLEGHIPRLLLVNPLHVKALAGRKTDSLDSEWLATRLQREDLKGSFIPPRPIRELRELTRTRVHWLQDLNRMKNRISQLCEAGNIKISSVATDLFGASGRRMLNALVEGKRDAGWMADYARSALRSKRDQLELALEGSFSDHQRWLLGQFLQPVNELESKVKSLTEEIERRVADYAPQIERLITIPGIDRVAAWTILAEIGMDMTVFPDAKHLASWAALCPGNRESGGKRMSGKTRKGNVYLRRILCQSAWAATRKKGSHLAALYHRIRSRRGHQKAILAVAHQILTIVYHLLRDGEVYKELGSDYYDLQHKPEITQKLIDRLQRMGYYVTLRPMPQPEGPDPGVPNGGASGGSREQTKAAQSRPAQTTEAPLPTKRKIGRPCKCQIRGIACKHQRPVQNSRSIPQNTRGPNIQTTER
jgi:transposase